MTDLAGTFGVKVERKKVKEVNEKEGRLEVLFENGEKANYDMLLYGKGDTLNTQLLPRDFRDSRDESVIVNTYF